MHRGNLNPLSLVKEQQVIQQESPRTTSRAQDFGVKSYFIRTYGCQMNELDTEIMAGQLEKWGLCRAPDEEQADLLLFNTCSIRDLAERKVMGKLGHMGRRRKRHALIGVAGCMAIAKKEALFKKFPHLDFVLGPNNIHHLVAVVEEALQTRRPVLRAAEQFEEAIDYLETKRDDTVKAFVSIIRGCNKFCTYCVVPYTRGQEVSRPPESILEECRQLVDKGYKEVMLLGQNVNSYGKDTPSWNCLFHDLLYQLDKIEGLHRIRFMTSHPVDITVELMEAIRDLPSLCDFVHFPLQAGSNRILKKMHRTYTKEQYFETVARFRQIAPKVSLGTDIIVGFPTETDADFEETCEAMRQIRYSLAFLFTYSPRKKTPAMRWKDDVPQEIKNQRLQYLTALQTEIEQEERQKMLGSTVEVLIEKTHQDGTYLKGRTRCWKKVMFPGPSHLLGTLQPVTIHGYSHQTLLGEMRDIVV